MARYSPGLGVVDLKRGLRTNLGELDVEEVDIVSKDMDAGEDQHRIGALAMEPLRLIQRKPPELGSKKTHKVPAHGQQDHHDIDGEHQARTTRYPY